MKLINKKYTILTRVEHKPDLNEFDFVFNTENINTDDIYSARVFQVTRHGGYEKTIALIDLILSEDEPFAVLEDDVLTVILFNTIVRVDLEANMITQRVDCDYIGGFFEIHPIHEGYIIWGECAIFRYDLELNQVWCFSGKDIFVCATLHRSFWIENELIHSRDFLGWHYVLDLNGKLLSEFMEMSGIYTPK